LSSGAANGIGSGGSGGFGIYDETVGAYRMVIDNIGNVGIGALTPQALLHVFNTNGSQCRLGTPFAGVVGSPPISGAIFGPADAAGVVGYGAYSTGALGTWYDSNHVIAVYGRVEFAGFAGYFDGDVKILGDVSAYSFNTTSDRNAKENFAAVDPREVLARVSALPISKWNLKVDPCAQHIGPMAQDFYAAFGTGSDDKHIATVDADGVALAAIQGLNQKLIEELNRRDAENAELKKRLDLLEQMVRKQQ